MMVWARCNTNVIEHCEAKRTFEDHSSYIGFHGKQSQLVVTSFANSFPARSWKI